MDSDSGLRAFQLRRVQLDAIDGVRDAWRSGQRRALLVLPTGVGKTITALETVRRAIKSKPDARVLWLAHREELVTQPLATVRTLDYFDAVSRVAGLVKGDFADYTSQVVFSSVQTMQHRADQYLEHGSPALVVLDEAHHYVPGRSWGDTALRVLGCDSTGAGGCFALGLTATPERADSVRLSAMWGDVPAYSFSLQEAIDSGYLVEPRFQQCPLAVDMDLRQAIDQANSDEGSDTDKELAQRLLKSGIAAHVVRTLRKIEGAATLVFCMDVAQVVATWAALHAAGHRVAYLTGKTGAVQRQEVLRRYNSNEIDVIVNCGVLTEGTDLPRTANIVLARPCGSKTLYIQIVGRGARLYPGKVRFDVWDVLGASKIHTLVSSVALAIGRDDEGLSRWVAVRPHFADGLRAPKGSLWSGRLLPATADRTALLQLHRPAPAMGGRPVGWMARSEPMLVSATGWSLAARESGRGFVVDPERKRHRWLPEWIELGHGVRALALGSYGIAFTIVSDDAQRVWPVIVPPRARKATLLNSRPVGQSIANDLVSEVGRQAAKVVNREADWRRLPYTENQLRYLRRLGIRIMPRNRGHAQRLISEYKAKATAQRLGFGVGWRP